MNRQPLARKIAWICFFILPAATIVFLFILWPLFLSLYNSIFDWNGLLRGDYIGLDNFRRLFSGIPYRERFTNALGNNVKWLVITLLGQNVTGLVFGYVLSRGIRGNNFYRRIFFIPVLFSIVAVGYLWGLFLKPKGLVNAFLIQIGRPDLVRAWLGDGKIATYVLIAVNIWRWIGFPTLVFMSAIDNISPDLFEAATLDGVNEWQLFWRIVLPLIIPSLTVVTVLTSIGSLNVFEQIYTMSGLDGPPNYATDTIGTLFYRTAFGSVDSGAPEIGIGSAIAVIIYILTFVISFASIKLSARKEEELAK